MNLAPLINIGCGKDLIICELAELVREVIGFTENLTFDSTKPDEPMQKLLSANKLKQLGWKATTSLREGITSAYKTDLMQSS